MIHKVLGLAWGLALEVALVLSGSAPAVADQLRFLNSNIAFASAEETGQRLIAADAYMQQVSSVDMQILAQSRQPVDKASLRTRLLASGRSFDAEELQILTSAVKKLEIVMKAKGYLLPLPKDVVFAKNDERLFEGWPYTRGNTIFWNKEVLQMPEPQLVSVVAHELFHVASRAHPELRKQVFSMVGFRPCEVELQSVAPAIRNIRITNPDTEDFGKYCITLKDGGKLRHYTNILVSANQYNGDNFSRIIHPVLIEVAGDMKTPVVKAGVTKVRELDAVYTAAIGGNALNEAIHPEEIIATNFATAVLGVPSPGNMNIPFASEIADAIADATH
jgi:hypothetical protein